MLQKKIVSFFPRETTIFSEACPTYATELF